MPSLAVFTLAALYDELALCSRVHVEAEAAGAPDAARCLLSADSAVLKMLTLTLTLTLTLALLAL